MTETEYRILNRVYNALAEFIDTYTKADIEDLEKAYQELENMAHVLQDYSFYDRPNKKPEHIETDCEEYVSKKIDEATTDALLYEEIDEYLYGVAQGKIEAYEEWLCKWRDAKKNGGKT